MPGRYKLLQPVLRLKKVSGEAEFCHVLHLDGFGLLETCLLVPSFASHTIQRFEEFAACMMWNLSIEVDHVFQENVGRCWTFS